MRTISLVLTLIIIRFNTNQNYFPHSNNTTTNNPYPKHDIIYNPNHNTNPIHKINPNPNHMHTSPSMKYTLNLRACHKTNPKP